MGYLTDILCCRRNKDQHPPRIPCVMGTELENCGMKLHRYNIPKRPKADVLHVLKYLQYSSSGSSVFVPVEIHEPLSFLQKLAEPFEHSYLLDRAAETADYGEQMKFIAAFIHIVALKICERSTLPFDALLGETYELDRARDLGFKLIAEQISIAPRIAAVHCAGKGWVYQSSFEYSVNIHTKFININPDVYTTIQLKEHDCEFVVPLALSYKLHNILFGETYFDIFGTLEITERRGRERYACRMEYLSKFSDKRNSADLVGTITRNKQALMNIRGYWDKGLEVCYQYSTSDAPTSEWTVFWEYRPVPRDREETYYFTEFAAQLNELEACIAPTDSRLRSDVRDLENGKIKSGNIHKRSLMLTHEMVGMLLEKMDMLHYAVQDPFIYLIHFLFHTQTFQNVFKSGPNRASFSSSVYSRNSYSLSARRNTKERGFTNWSGPNVLANVELTNSNSMDKPVAIMPAKLHEPLTMLQRLTEMFEFSLLLDAAAVTTDVAQQLIYLASFSFLSYSTLYERVTKPFKPLLGETYECDRFDELGWRCIAEQVEYLPPICVVHCEATKWVCRQELSLDVNVHGRHVSILPKGYVKVKFIDQDCEFEWERNNIKIHKHVTGKLIPEVQGTTKIIGLGKAAGYKCSLHYKSRKNLLDDFMADMEGSVLYKSRPLAMIRGCWGDGVTASPIKPVKGSETDITHMAADFTLVYRKTPIPKGREMSYNFSKFACTLNKMQEGIAPTDSRFRQDVISLDSGLLGECSEIQRSLEEKQMKRMSSNWNKVPTEQYKPTWFSQNETGEWIYNDQYWNCKEMQDWSRCPEIF